MRIAISARFLALAATTSIILGGSQAASALPLRVTEILQQHGFAAYQWRGVTRPGTIDAVRAQAQFLHAQGFKTVYLNLGDYLRAADQQRSQANRAHLLQFSLNLKRYVSDASSQGLAVQAVGGDPAWARASRRYMGAKLVQVVSRHNVASRANERLKGVQFDIEPYRNPAFFKNTTAALVGYLETVQRIVDEFRRQRILPANKDLQLGFAIPHWFDGQRRAPGPVPFNGTIKPAAFHLIDMIKDLPEAYVVVMSYRNFASGSDGSIMHAQGEFRYANSIAAKSGLVVGQEYGDIRPAKVTFHGMGRTAFKREAEEIAGAFGRYPQFRGLSVNDLKSYAAAND